MARLHDALWRPKARERRSCTFGAFPRRMYWLNDGINCGQVAASRPGFDAAIWTAAIGADTGLMAERVSKIAYITLSRTRPPTITNPLHHRQRLYAGPPAHSCEFARNFHASMGRYMGQNVRKVGVNWGSRGRLSHRERQGCSPTSLPIHFGQFVWVDCLNHDACQLKNALCIPIVIEPLLIPIKI